MCDELTNPDVLEALEIVSVEFTRIGFEECGLAAYDGRVVVIAKGTGTARDATPADLDHALKSGSLTGPARSWARTVGLNGSATCLGRPRNPTNQRL